jgi:tripartite-type tricarboxylate transporter receptor subunit TctC
MKKLILGTLAVILVVFVLSGCATSAPAQSPATSPITSPGQSAAAPDVAAAAAFFKGKSISFYIPAAAGGGHDLACRIFGEAVAKYTGAAVEPVNKVGGDMLLAPVYVVNIPNPDGLNISACSTLTTEVAQLLKSPGFEKMDLSKWNWLCSIRGSSNIVFVKAQSPYKTLGDLVKAKGLKMDITGITTPSAVFAIMILEKTMGMQNLTVLSAISGVAEKMAVVLRGEFDFADIPARNILQFKDQTRALCTLGAKRDPLLPDVPTLAEAMKDAGIDVSNADTQYWIGVVNQGKDSLTSTFAPPGVPADRVAFLRQAFDKAGKDPDVIAKGNKGDLDFDYIPGDQLAKTVSAFVNMDPARLAEFKKSMATLTQ